MKRFTNDVIRFTGMREELMNMLKGCSKARDSMIARWLISRERGHNPEERGLCDKGMNAFRFRQPGKANCTSKAYR